MTINPALEDVIAQARRDYLTDAIAQNQRHIETIREGLAVGEIRDTKSAHFRIAELEIEIERPNSARFRGGRFPAYPKVTGEAFRCCAGKTWREHLPWRAIPRHCGRFSTWNGQAGPKCMPDVSPKGCMLRECESEIHHPPHHRTVMPTPTPCTGAACPCSLLVASRPSERSGAPRSGVSRQPSV